MANYVYIPYQPSKEEASRHAKNLRHALMFQRTLAIAQRLDTVLLSSQV